MCQAFSSEILFTCLSFFHFFLCTAKGYLPCCVWKVAHTSHNLFHCVSGCGQFVHAGLASSSVAIRSDHDHWSDFNQNNETLERRYIHISDERHDIILTKNM